VRKAAALALPKLFLLDPSMKGFILFYLDYFLQ
jgi:hypothetical protein